MHIRPVAWWVARKRKATWQARFFCVHPCYMLVCMSITLGPRSPEGCMFFVFNLSLIGSYVINQTGLAHRNCKLVTLLSCCTDGGARACVTSCVCVHRPIIDEGEGFREARHTELRRVPRPPGAHARALSLAQYILVTFDGACGCFWLGRIMCGGGRLQMAETSTETASDH
jgi:hypothetical protein